MMCSMEDVDADRLARRPVKFNNVSELGREIDRLADAANVGRLRPSTELTLAQAYAQLAYWIECSFDGCPAHVQWPIRVLARMRKAHWLESGLPDSVMQWLLEHRTNAPTPSVDHAADAYLRQLSRIAGNEPMTARHPIFGELSQAEWTRSHLRLAELLLGLFVLESASHVEEWDLPRW